jgi:hypothetical protein
MASHIREHGTEVSNPDTGEERLAVLRRIVERKQYAKVDGCMIDLFSASAIVKIYDALTSPEAKAKYRNCRAPVMAKIAFQLMK